MNDAAVCYVPVPRMGRQLGDVAFLVWSVKCQSVHTKYRVIKSNYKESGMWGYASIRNTILASQVPHLLDIYTAALLTVMHVVSKCTVIATAYRFRYHAIFLSAVKFLSFRLVLSYFAIGREISELYENSYLKRMNFQLHLWTEQTINGKISSTCIVHYMFTSYLLHTRK